MVESWWVGATHLPRGDRVSCRAAFERVVRLVSALPEPWLLVGDFNLESAEAGELASHVTVSPHPARPTYPVGDPIECIDYCVQPPSAEVWTEVLPHTGSDHHPILLTVRSGSGSPSQPR